MNRTQWTPDQNLDEWLSKQPIKNGDRVVAPVPGVVNGIPCCNGNTYWVLCDDGTAVEVTNPKLEDKVICEQLSLEL